MMRGRDDEHGAGMEARDQAVGYTQLLPDDEIWLTRLENRNRGQNRRLKSHHKSRHKSRHNDLVSSNLIKHETRFDHCDEICHEICMCMYESRHQVSDWV